MPILTLNDNSLATELRESIAANIVLGKAETLLEPLSPEAQAWVLKKLVERLKEKEWQTQPRRK